MDADDEEIAALGGEIQQAKMARMHNVEISRDEYDAAASWAGGADVRECALHILNHTKSRIITLHDDQATAGHPAVAHGRDRIVDIV
jgi:hypothetical protein